MSITKEEVEHGYREQLAACAQSPRAEVALRERSGIMRNS
jgi:hypothetical protein